MNNNHTPLVTIVMPSYNSEKHIAESIQSIINQTFTDWEFIIVDGHSEDKTIEIVNNFIANDPRIKLIFDEKKGIGPALNQGCEMALGKYIARMDTDDISMPERLEKEINYLENHTKVGLVSCCAYYFDDNGNTIGQFFPYTWSFIIKRCATCILHPGVLMRKEMYEKAGGYPPIKRAEDLMLWYKMMKYCNVKILHENLVKYRVSKEALSNYTTEYFNTNVNSIWRKYADKPIGNKEIKEIEMFVNSNITNEGVPITRVKSSEDRIFMLLSKVFSSTNAHKMVLFLKNLYGLKKL